MMPEPTPCPKCGCPLPNDAPQGLCPRCLAALNFATETMPLDSLPVAPQQPLTAEELAPHFPQLEILDCLGRGGMGVVYKARQKSLNRMVALKLLAPERAEDAKFAGRFEREAQALAALSHPHIVTIHDFGQAGGFYFLLMEFIDGVNLRQAMNAGRFTPEQALTIIPPVCEALQYAHEHSIVHRDIKPENLLLDKTGRVKIADFGIAKILGDERPEGADVSDADEPRSQAFGTPAYAAPEQQNDSRHVDHRADIYSLGVVLYELLTGELPNDKLGRLRPRVRIDVRLEEVVLRALQATPEMRFATAEEFRTQLAGVGVAMPAPTVAAATPQRSRRRRWLGRAAMGMLTLLLAAAALVYWRPQLMQVAAPLWPNAVVVAAEVPPTPRTAWEQRLQQEIQRLRDEKKKLGATLGLKHPQMLSLDTQIALLQEHWQQELQKPGRGMAPSVTGDPRFFTTTGTFSLNKRYTLHVNSKLLRGKDPTSSMRSYTLRSSIDDGTHGVTSFAPLSIQDELFLIYWDRDLEQLWLASPTILRWHSLPETGRPQDKVFMQPDLPEAIQQSMPEPFARAIQPWRSSHGVAASSSILTMPRNPNARVTLLATLSRAHYFGQDVPGQDEMDCLWAVAHQSNASEMDGRHVFMKRDSPVAKRLLEDLPWGRQKLCIVTLIWRQNGAAGWFEVFDASLHRFNK